MSSSTTSCCPSSAPFTHEQTLNYTTPVNKEPGGTRRHRRHKSIPFLPSYLPSVICHLYLNLWVHKGNPNLQFRRAKRKRKNVKIKHRKRKIRKNQNKQRRELEKNLGINADVSSITGDIPTAPPARVELLQLQPVTCCQWTEQGHLNWEGTSTLLSYRVQ